MKTFSALTADVRRDPSIIDAMKRECLTANAALTTYVLTLGAVTTVVPVLP